ncbi:MAG TPA: histidine kinase dimerization/phospho-acceptor domain-containing protein, partial [Luteolibacter sp.]
MRTSRSLLIWATLALCGVMVLGAMTWLTRGVLASEKERAGAQARADLEECTRLALWRMDAAGAAIVSAENRHPAADYQTGSTALTAGNDPLAKLHFELRESGRLSSPEAARDKLAALRALLGRTPIPGDEWSQLKCAADASETAWSLVPKDAPEEKSANTQLRKNKAGNRSDTLYQSNFNAAEKTQRAKTVEETVSNNGFNPANTESAQAIQMDGDDPAVTNLGMMRAVWIGGDLFLLRQFTRPQGGKGVQGVWLDHEVLKQRLLAEVKDLLPAADLTAAPDAARDPLALVSFPFRLIRNQTAPVMRATINGPLLIGWVAVLLALLTTCWLVHGVMRLSERRASFVSAVTHELRTPLTTFRLYSDMLANGAVKPEKRGDYLRVLSREADRLSHLVENVLSFSKVERGSARSLIREITVAELLEPMRDR